MYPFYFAVVMLAPAAMLIVGLMWKISPPPYQSKGLAYSTDLTRKDPEAWTMAHRHCGQTVAAHRDYQRRIQRLFDGPF